MRTREVVWSRSAHGSLIDFAYDLALVDGGAARHLTDSVVAAAASLASEDGPLVPELTGGLRELVVGHYRLIYRATPGRVQVVALVTRRIQ